MDHKFYLFGFLLELYKHLLRPADIFDLLYIERPKEDCIRSILQRTISIDEIVSRISSIDEEQKNKKFCDYIIQNNKDLNNTVNEILHIMEDK